MTAENWVAQSTAELQIKRREWVCQLHHNFKYNKMNFSRTESSQSIRLSILALLITVFKSCEVIMTIRTQGSIFLNISFESQILFGHETWLTKI